MGHPIVVHPLGVFGVSDDPGHIQTPVNFKFVADDANNGDVLARPLALFKNFVPVDLAVLDLAPVRLACLQRLAKLRLQQLIFGRTLKRRDVPWVQIQRGTVVVNVVVVRNADRVFVEPLRQILVTDAQRLQGRDRR